MKKGPATRAAILQEAFRLSYSQGYHLTSIDDILRNLDITKGSFYHHFHTKEEMGTAVIEEFLAPQMKGMYEALLGDGTGPVKAILGMMKRLLFEEPALLAAYGCPVGNLAQELGAAESYMRTALQRVMAVWQASLSDFLKRAIHREELRKGLKPDAIAIYLIAGYWGIRTLGKVADSKQAYKQYLVELKRYLEGLQPGA